MGRLIYQYINAAPVTKQSVTSQWRLHISELDDNADNISQSRIVYKSPYCDSKQECIKHAEEFNRDA